MRRIYIHWNVLFEFQLLYHTVYIIFYAPYEFISEMYHYQYVKENLANTVGQLFTSYWNRDYLRMFN